MQKLMGLVRRCVDDYAMISEGDRIAVGVSGGKDSLVLLVLLAGLRKYFNKSFTLEAITIDMGLGMDYSSIQKLCDDLEVPYSVVVYNNKATFYVYNPDSVKDGRYDITIDYNGETYKTTVRVRD